MDQDDLRSDSTPASDSADAETVSLSGSSTKPAPPPTSGTMISRFVVIEEVGRGGMGRVLRAYDPKLQREVALKQVRDELLGAEVKQRLVQEARAMAKLSHPNVVSVYDVDERGSGEIVLVMEYVAGETLRQWLRRTSPSWPQTVACFAAAGRGLAAAHDSGLLHRDFKPSNVLVAESGEVKVTDFGLAKTSTTTPSESSTPHSDAGLDDPAGLVTRAGVVVGTPPYMAPEQHRGEPLTAQADQYAFCVSLWRALCGKAPFEGDTLEQLQDAKSLGPPAWPESSTPRAIAAAITRGLSPDPDERWSSMHALLDALAWDPSPARRRRAWALGVVLVAAAAAGGTHAWLVDRGDRCGGADLKLAGIWEPQRRAEVETTVLDVEAPFVVGAWERTRNGLDRYVDDWTTMHADACKATVVRGEQSPAMLDLRMGCLNRSLQSLRAVVDTLADADLQVMQSAHELVADLPPLSRCADAEALSVEVEPPLPSETGTVDEIRQRLAESAALRNAKRYESAQATLEDAKALASSVDYGPVQTEVAYQEGRLLTALGEYDRAETRLSDALELAGRWDQEELMADAVLELIFVVGVRKQEHDNALRYVSLAQGLTHGDPLREATLASNIGSVLGLSRDLEGAEQKFREALAISGEVLGARSTDEIAWRNNLAIVLARRGEHQEAEAEHRRVLELTQELLGPDHPNVGGIRINLAIALFLQRELDEAESQLRLALADWEESRGANHPTVATLRNNLAAVLTEKGEHADAEVQLRLALAARLEALEPDHPHVATTRYNLSLALAGQDEHEDAELEARAALQSWERSVEPEHPDIAMAQDHLASVLLELDRIEEARSLAERAWVRRQRDDIPKVDRAEGAIVLANALWASSSSPDDRNRARALAEDALRSAREAGEGHAERVRDVEQWLRDHPEP